MKQSTKKSAPAQTSAANHALPESDGGVPLSDLGHAAITARRIAIQRQAVRRSHARAESFVQPAPSTDENVRSVFSDHPMTPKTGAEYKKEVRDGMEKILNLLLADEYLLYKITRDYLWNVSGPDYFSLRLQFQLQHDETAGWVDAVMEQIRKMHFATRISWEDLKASARCSAAPGFELPAKNMLVELLGAHDQLIAQLHADAEVCLQRFGDAAIAGFLSTLREQHENAAWMLRAQLETADMIPSEPFLSLN